MSHVTKTIRLPMRGGVVAALKDPDPEFRKRLRAVVLMACVKEQAVFFGEAFGHIFPPTNDVQRGWLVLMKAGLPPKLFEAYDQQNWPFVSMLLGVALAGIENGRLGHPLSGS